MAQDLLSLYWYVGAPLAGLVLGSFSNVCIHRIPRDESIVTPRSRCPRCGTPIRAVDNVPVVSYLFLLGRCRSCRARISPRYPLVELANGAGYLAIALSFPPSLRAVLSMAFLTALIVLSLIDLDHQILPNVITIPGTLIAASASFLPGWPIGPVESIASAVGGYLGLALFATLYRRLRGIEALGQGDWKMVAMLGAFFGWRVAVLILFLASVSGTLVGLGLMLARRGNLQLRLPLGTFLGAAGLACIFFGQRILEWYGGFFHGG